MNPFERMISAIIPTKPAVEFFGADGSRRDATEELKRCFEGPVEIDPSTLPIEFARKVERAFGTTVTQETDEPQPDTFATLDSSLDEPLITHHLAVSPTKPTPSQS